MLTMLLVSLGAAVGLSFIMIIRETFEDWALNNQLAEECKREGWA